MTAVREHLQADLRYQSRLLRFLKNHDESRIADRLSDDAERAAAIALATLPGATHWHESQFDRDLADWYRRLLAAVAIEGVRRGDWRQLTPTGCPDSHPATCSPGPGAEAATPASP